MENNGVRINKFLGDAGVCSRREADTLISKGNVKIDGVVHEFSGIPGHTCDFSCYTVRSF